MRNIITVALLLAPVTGLTLLPSTTSVRAQEMPGAEAPAEAPAETPGAEAPAETPGAEAPAEAPGAEAPAETPGAEAPGAEAPGAEAPGAEAPKAEEGSGDIVSVATNAGSFKTLAAALDAAGLTETLKGDGPFTVFAPTDQAFAALPAGVVEELLKPENKNQLAALLTYHVVPGKVMAADIQPGDVATVQGSKVTVAVTEGAVKVNNASVVSPDVQASNGVIHVVDQVILPPSYAGGAQQQAPEAAPDTAPAPDAAPAPDSAPAPDAATPAPEDAPTTPEAAPTAP